MSRTSLIFPYVGDKAESTLKQMLMLCRQGFRFTVTPEVDCRFRESQAPEGLSASVLPEAPTCTTAAKMFAV